MKLITNTLAVCTFTAVALTSGIAQATNAKAVENDGFSLLDMDHDGQVTTTEAAIEPLLVEAFASIDTDGDNQLSKQEYDAYLAKSAKKS